MTASQIRVLFAAALRWRSLSAVTACRGGRPVGIALGPGRAAAPAPIRCVLRRHRTALRAQLPQPAHRVSGHV